MNKQITSVFYDANLLPFKDSARTIHYPLTSGTFVGSHNTKQIRFYVRDIGGTDDITWVVLSKLPNGKLGYEICSNVAYDSEVGEYYLQFDLSAYYTSVKGDLYLSLRGYEGEVEFEDDNNDGVYNIVGEPLIEVTGTIKLAINYSPMVNTGTQVLPTDIDKLILALNNYIPKDMGIVVIPNLSYNVGSYNDGQIFFVEEQKAFYKKVSGALVKEEIALPFAYLTTQTAEELYQLYGNRVFTLEYYSSLLICELSYNLDRLYEFAVYQYDMQEGNNITCYRIGTNTGSDSFASLLSSATQIKTFATKEYVDSQLQEFLQKEYDKVDISEYPTLDDFLSSTGEEGYIYLYPVDISDESKGYYQYIWENNAWVSLGSTNIDLSGYLEKTTSANKVYATDNSGNQTTISVDSFYEGNIVRRDSDNSITVPLTPTQNGHASSKKYVDDEINDLSSEVDDKLEEKANVDGNYPTLTAGLADNLTPYSEDSGAEQENPFISNGTGTNNNTEIVTVGDYGLLKEKQGNSVVVNQLVLADRNTTTLNDITITNNGDGTFTLNGTASSLTSFEVQSGYSRVKLNNGHKYLLIGCPNGGSISTYDLRLSQTNMQGYDYGNGLISTALTDNLAYVIITIRSGTTCNNLTFKPKLFDLTQWFNGNIPQDLLDNPSHFSWYYNGSLDYNTGSLENANGVKLVSTGRNIYNSNETYNVVIPNKPFFVSKTTIITYYDKDKNSIGTESVSAGNTFTTPSNCLFINSSISAITITPYYTEQQGGEGYKDNNNVPIEYTYEQPYEVDTGSEVLRKAGSVYDYKDPNGTIHRLVGGGAINQFTGGSIISSEEGICAFYGYSVMPRPKGNSDQTKPSNVVSNKFEKIGVYYIATAGRTTKNELIAIASDGTTYIKSSLFVGKTTFAQCQAVLTNDYVAYYELNTPTTEQGTPFAENLPINDYGMLYWLDSSDNLVGIPQGAKIFYPVNYKGFVDDMYRRADGDSSKYVMQDELQASETQRDTIDTQLLNAIGGTLRQCLCVKASLDFNNTDILDLGNVAYEKATVSSKTCFRCNISGLKHSTNDNVAQNILSTNQNTISYNALSTSVDKVIAVRGATPVDGIIIYDSSKVDLTATEFQNAMKGVLFAYEKA